jgi:hypothetical protein
MAGGQRWPMLVAVSAIVLLTAGSGWFEAAERNGAFSLAILRRDGILLPFASYDGRAWENRWPLVGKSVSLPIALPDTPKGWWLDKQAQLEWSLFPLHRTQTPAAGTVRVKAINFYRAGCQQAVGLFTDYKPSELPPPPRVHPYPKDALAYSGDVKITPIESLNPTGDVAKALLTILPEDVTKKEDAMVERFETGRWRHSYIPSQRHDTPIQLEALYRVLHGFVNDLYYFEGVKRYFLPKNTPPEKGAHCDLVTFVSGWFTIGPSGRIGDLSARVVVTSCDFRNVNFMLPLGTIKVDEIIVQWSNATFESYMIGEARPGPGKLPLEFVPLIETPGGACNAESDSDEERN